MFTDSDADIEKAQRLINDMQPGVYELKQIFGEEWKENNDPTHYGAIFKKLVENNRLTNISVGEKKSNNHLTYIIIKQD
ncbi:MAG: single-stranded DNA-binding protein [Proteobacteria bacterium]|nr:single-stranded DNA-binding protein [Pseudomonadota bacterium]